jgi:hypothetical protein
VPCWDGGAAQQPEDEREQQDSWEDPFGGDLPGKPRGPEDEEWKPADWPEYLAGPEYWLYRKKWRDEE